MKLPSTLGKRPTLQMLLRTQARLSHLALPLLAFQLLTLNGQAQLPPTQPTALPTPAAAPGTPAARRAHVTFADGLLQVQADDSSLNQILHDISRRTGMTITGGVVDQRVFGNYGPAEPSTVLATLLDGTGTNVLLRTKTDSTPLELVLTPRTGGATPPNPNAAGFDDSPEEDRHQDRPEARPAPMQQPPQQQNFSQRPPPPRGFPGQAQNPIQQNNTQPDNSQQTNAPAPPDQPANNPLGNPANASPTASTLNTTNSVPLDSVSSPTTAVQPNQGIVDAPNPPPAGSTSNADGTTTSAPATPESIYQQLLQLQKKNAAQPASSNQ